MQPSAARYRVCCLTRVWHRCQHLTETLEARRGEGGAAGEKCATTPRDLARRDDVERRRLVSCVLSACVVRAFGVRYPRIDHAAPFVTQVARLGQKSGPFRTRKGGRLGQKGGRLAEKLEAGSCSEICHRPRDLWAA